MAFHVERIDHVLRVRDLASMVALRQALASGRRRLDELKLVQMRRRSMLD